MAVQEAQNEMKEMFGFAYGDEKVIVGTLKRYGKDMMGAEFTLLDIHGEVKSYNEKHGTSVRVIRPLIADYLLVNARRYPMILRFTFPTSAVIAYEGPEEALKEDIVYTTRHNYTGKSTGHAPKMILSTGKYKGRKGIALVVPDLALDDMGRDGDDIRIEVPDSRLVVVPDFPSKDGFYAPHPDTAVPYGKEVSYPSDYRELYRDKGSYVGPISRNGDIYDEYCRKEIYASGFPISGLVVEIPEKDLEKIPGTVKMLKL